MKVKIPLIFNSNYSQSRDYLMTKNDWDWQHNLADNPGAGNYGKIPEYLLATLSRVEGTQGNDGVLELTL